jgi:hypothetical protein
MRGIITLAGTAYAHEKLDLTDDAAKGPTASNLANGTLPAKEMLVSVEANTCNFSEHGVAPTATSGTNIGHKMAAGTSYVVNGIENITNFKIINAVAGSDGIPKLTYYS